MSHFYSHFWHHGGGDIFHNNHFLPLSRYQLDISEFNSATLGSWCQTTCISELSPTSQFQVSGCHLFVLLHFIQGTWASMDLGIHTGPRTNPPWIPSGNLTSGPVFTNRKKSKEDFHFMKKGDKRIQCWFCSKLLWRQGTPNSESGPPQAPS